MDRTTTACPPSSGLSTRSTVISTSPDQSREKRTVTVCPSASRSTSACPAEKTKYQVESVISLPTAPLSPETCRRESWDSSPAVTVSSMSGVSRPSNPSTCPENTPAWLAVRRVVSWAAWLVRAEICSSTASREAWMAAAGSAWAVSPPPKVYSRL